MPIEQPGHRYSVVATKATDHGKPAVELRHAGIAAKSTQAAPAIPSDANATAAVHIPIGEEFVVMMSGVHEVAVSALPGGAAAGDRVYITIADNSLVLAATALSTEILQAGYIKFGLIDSIDTDLGRALVNLNQRAAF